MRSLTSRSAIRSSLRYAFGTGALSLVLATAFPGSSTVLQAQDPCAPPLGNAVKCENALAGNPKSEWDVAGAGDSTIQGFATEMSVNRGETVQFKVSTTATNYRLDIYRLGYYAGNGARKVATVTPSVTLPQTQPNCATDPATGLVDCGNWAVSASWAVPATAVSGVYIARLVRTDTNGASHIVFVVRNDSGNSKLLFQTSDATWQAYNHYGGNSLYFGSPAGRAYKVSYNRPLIVRGLSVPNSLFYSEYPMIRFLEANGFDVSYTSSVDTDRRGAELLEHGVFLSVGHDEYWSGGQRANVEAARDAGVHLAFFSGNSVVWKTRWENSIAGTSTPYRTLVCYKETHANAKIDPTSTWTGTWRDPRFSPPSDGGRPENALLGGLFMIFGESAADSRPMEVPQAYSALRFWRNTNIATLSPGQVATIGDDTLGYESGEDVDNGFRPAGLVRLSSTTFTGSRLTDYGTSAALGVSVHNMLMHKRPNGAIVFDASTIQWSWALDATHDSVTPPIDARARQATINLLADMGAQPTTLIAGLVTATASTDNTAPTSAITAPSAGQSIPTGTFTITGTATDTGGGVVGGIDVSTDGGLTWHPATGTSNWSYVWTPTVTGTYTIAVRSVDDSGNLQSLPASRTVSVVNPTCPCSFWNPATTTPALSANDPTPYELGIRFTPSQSGTITGIRFYKSATNTGTHVGKLWSASGTQLASVTFTGETASGWQTASFGSPVAVTAGTTYVASYFAPVANAVYTVDYFGSPFVSGPLTAPGTNNGVYRAGSTGFPNLTWMAANFWVDVIFVPAGADTTPPAVSLVSPTNGGTAVPVSSVVSATFNEAMQSASLTASTFTLRNASNQLVTATVSYNTSNLTATLTPASPLATNTVYTARLTGGSTGVKDAAGNPLTADYTWSFTTAASAGCPCSFWSPSTTTPVLAANDPTPYELGIRFSASQNGTISGIRFYKSAGNTGTHVGRLWTSTGTQLASVTFTGESASGWQTATFSSPVAITAGTTYVASYFAPVANAAYTENFFVAPLSVGPLTAGTTNGVYRAGSTGFPSLTWNSANFWVDVIFNPSGGDTTAPTVSSVSPAAGATGIPVSTTVSATFSEGMLASSLTTSTVTLRNPSNQVVAATVAYNATTLTATLTPSAALAGNTVYTARILGGASGAKDAAGNALAADFTWTFTTTAPVVCPCSFWNPATTTPTLATNDPNPYEFGIRFTPSQNGTVTGVRFYKSATNTGTHVGKLWSSTGTLLASATFSGESTSGWQTVLFGSPVAVTAGTTYVASYYAPVANAAYTTQFFTTPLTVGPLTAPAGTNGVYKAGTPGFPNLTWEQANFWVDVIFQ